MLIFLCFRKSQKQHIHAVFQVVAETTVRDPEERGARRQREIMEQAKLCATA